MTMNTHRVYYFAYGSNMSSERVQRRVPSSISLGTLRLFGYRLCTNKKSKDGSSKCNLIIDDDTIVWGVLYSLLESELPKLHRAEGLGYGYEEKRVHIQYNEETISVFFYVAQSTHICHDLLPYEWYMKYVQMGAIEHQLPKEYMFRIMNWPTQIDANSERRESNIKKMIPRAEKNKTFKDTI